LIGLGQGSELLYSSGSLVIVTKMAHSNKQKDDSDKGGGLINLTRRDAIVAAATGAVAKGIGVGSIGTAVADEGIELELADDGDFGNIDDGEGEATEYRQVENGAVTSLSIADEAGSPLMSSLIDPELEDDFIIGETALKINGGSYETFGQETKQLDDDQDEIEFTGVDLWEQSSYDFGEETEFEGIGEDYEVLSVDVDALEEKDVEDITSDDLTETTQLDLRFRMVSSQNNFSEEAVLTLILHIGVPLGFGRFFGVNFGSNHIEDWEDVEWNNPEES